MTHPPPIPLDEAQARLLAGVAPLECETVAAASAAGRYLAASLPAQRSQPAADLSAMDGYAMLADDLAGPWQVVGESAAGHPYSGTLGRGQAVRISTGALMPQGAGAVLLQENAQRKGAALSLNGEGDPTPGHIRRTGFDFRQGDMLLASGTAIGAAQIALAVSGGHAHLPVARLPRVAVIDSGDELAADPADAAQHIIPASNGAMLAAMVQPACAHVQRIGPVRDRIEDLVDALEQAGEADVVVTSGGASVGDHDLVRPALERWGATIDFWRIAIKPGKPLLVARRGRQVILGLPGNPVSGYVTAFLFLLPVLRRLAGAGQPLPSCLHLPTAQALPGTGPRTEFVRARLGPEGVEPLGEQDSSALFALSRAQVLIRRESGAQPARPGEQVPIYLLGNGGIA